MNDQPDINEIFRLIETTNLNMATLGRIFELVVNDFLKEFNSFKEFLVLDEEEHKFCLNELQELEKQHKITDKEFSTAVYLFSCVLKSLLAGDRTLSEGIIERVFAQHNEANKVTMNQLIGG